MGVLNTQGWDKFVIFDGKSRKRDFLYLVYLYLGNGTR